MKIKFLIGSSFWLLFFYFSACQQPPGRSEFSWQGQTMGTVYSIRVIHYGVPADSAEVLKNSVDLALREVNRQMSTWLEDSEITLFNRHQSVQPFRVSKEFAAVVRKSLQISEISEGAFDITVAPLVDLWGFGKKGRINSLPADSAISRIRSITDWKNIMIVNDTTIQKRIPRLQLNLSAIAKGYGVDVAAEVVRRAGFKEFLVEIGGEVAARGKNLRGENWHIGIDKPKTNALPGNDLQEVISVSGVGVATSGDYRNFFEQDGRIYSHTIDPATGKPVTHNLASVTVVAPTCMEADALATAVLVSGPIAGLKIIEDRPQTEALLIIREPDGKFSEILSSGFNKLLAKN